MVASNAILDVVTLASVSFALSAELLVYVEAKKRLERGRDQLPAAARKTASSRARPTQRGALHADTFPARSRARTSKQYCQPVRIPPYVAVVPRKPAAGPTRCQPLVQPVYVDHLPRRS